MSADPEAIREEAHRWLSYARDDLQAAEVLLESREAAGRIACFHAQQAAEKALKSLLVLRSTPYEKTHDLVALHRLLPPGAEVGVDDAALAELSEWAVEPLYPGDAPTATREDARRAVVQARSIVDAVESKLAHGEAGPRR